MTPTEVSIDDKPDLTAVDDRSAGLRHVLSLRDFRLLLVGGSTSLLGDQFALIATPWLVLQLSDDPLALGIVLALEGIPRAVFMLVGGAITDRLSARRVMFATDIARGVLTAVMAVIVLSGMVQMWMLYGFALGFGLIAGLALPAQNSIVPTLVKRDDLEAGNALIMGATQLSAFVGPTLAGAVIAAYSASTRGVGLAFAVDAVTFAISATTFALMRTRRAPVANDATTRLWAAIGDGFRNLWDDAVMRFVFTVLAAVNLFAVGPLLVGIPLLAHDRFAASAMAFGVLMAAFAIGNLFTWLQASTPHEMLGRTMSLVTFASLGLVSLSQGLAGALSSWSLSALFVLSGGLVLSATAWAAANPGLAALTDSMTKSPEPKDREHS